MIQKKVCMLGAYSVGKTSLVQRYVHSIFSEKYMTTVGVKIDKKAMVVDEQDITLMLWDMVGKDDYSKVATKQLRGASGYLLVVDPTRPATFDVGLEIRKIVVDNYGEIPFVVAMNKHDLEAQWILSKEQKTQIESLKESGWSFINTSAKNGEAVEDVFECLTRQMLKTA